MNGATTPELLDRISRLESEVEALRSDRDRQRERYRSLLDQIVPFVPVSSEELDEMLNAPRGEPILSVIEEYERQCGIKA